MTRKAIEDIIEHLKAAQIELEAIPEEVRAEDDDYDELDELLGRAQYRAECLL